MAKKLCFHYNCDEPRVSYASRCEYHHREWQREYAQRIRAEAHFIMGVHCSKCRYAGKAVQIDHIHGNINKEGTRQVCGKIIKGETEEYQLLCANCNWEKRYALGEVAGYLDKED